MDGYFSSTSYRGFALQGSDADTSEQAHRDAALDEALSCTFPASDPVALNFAFISLARADQKRQGAKSHPVRRIFTEKA